MVVNRSKLLSFWENRVFYILATDRQIDGHHRCVKPQSCYRELRLNNVGNKNSRDSVLDLIVNFKLISAAVYVLYNFYCMTLCISAHNAVTRCPSICPSCASIVKMAQHVSKLFSTTRSYANLFCRAMLCISMANAVVQWLLILRHVRVLLWNDCWNE